MSLVASLLGDIGKALLDYGGRRVVDRVWLGDSLFFVADFLIKSRSAELLFEELKSCSQAKMNEVRPLITTLIPQIAREVSTEQQHALAAYLEQVPTLVRKAVFESDLLSHSHLLTQPEYLSAILPLRAPLFRIQDSPESIGGWVVVKLLGQGGFGEVWLAHHPAFQSTRAAFKFCVGNENEKRLLKHEAKIVNQVMKEGKYPGIVALLDSNLDCEPPWLKYELIEGGDLSRLVKEWQSLTFQDRFRNVSKAISHLSKAIGYFHRLRPSIIHRDLKPSNILVERKEIDKEGWNLRVADFGIGNIAMMSELTSSNERLPTFSMRTQLNRAYTPLYASPQQRCFAEPDVRDDIYALGVIWYQMLIQDFTVGIPRSDWRTKFRNEGVSDAYLDLLESCFADDPKQRPEDGEILYLKLQHLFDQSSRSSSSTDLTNTKQDHATNQQKQPKKSVRVSQRSRRNVIRDKNQTRKKLNSESAEKRNIRSLQGGLIQKSVFSIGLANLVGGLGLFCLVGWLFLNENDQLFRNLSHSFGLLYLGIVIVGFVIGFVGITTAKGKLVGSLGLILACAHFIFPFLFSNNVSLSREPEELIFRGGWLYCVMTPSLGLAAMQHRLGESAILQNITICLLEWGRVFFLVYFLRSMSVESGNHIVSFILRRWFWRWVKLSFGLLTIGCLMSVLLPIEFFNPQSSSIGKISIVLWYGIPALYLFCLVFILWKLHRRITRLSNRPR